MYDDYRFIVDIQYFDMAYFSMVILCDEEKLKNWWELNEARSCGAFYALVKETHKKKRGDLSQYLKLLSYRECDIDE